MFQKYSVKIIFHVRTMKEVFPHIGQIIEQILDK